VTTAFVAGATGLTGREVVQVLRQRGILTRAHVRPDSSSLEEWKARFAAVGAEVDATPWELSAMTETLARVAPEWVFALLGTTRARGKQSKAATGQADTYESVDYGLSVMLLNACLASGHRPRFVYLSAIGVSDTSSSAYASARARVERELRGSGLPFTIARPSFILGDRDESRPAERVGSAISDAALRFVGALGGAKVRDRYRSIAAPDLAQSLVRIALDSRYAGRIVSAEDLHGL
jgi:uncharacterized protein YbjT (DUF2867 family)